MEAVPAFSRSRRARLPVCSALSWFWIGCQPPAPVTGAASTASTASTASMGAASTAAPAPPRPSITGCVESRELKRYVLALDTRRDEARRAALAALGATVEQRPAVFAGGGTTLALDRTLDSAGRRWVVAAQVAPGFAPEARLARIGDVLYRLEERPRALAAPLLACGVQRCRRPRDGAARAPLPIRSVLIELRSGERWGGALAVRYDYWWADVGYDRAEACGPGEAPAPRRPQPRASSAASATP